MKILWCWRCQMEVPMLDEIEWAELMASQEPHTHGGGFHAQRQALLNIYERVTGFHETNPNAVGHHRIAQYGPPCQECGKPLRTPRAQLCAACGAVRG